MHTYKVWLIIDRINRTAIRMGKLRGACELFRVCGARPVDVSDLASWRLAEELVAEAEQQRNSR